MANIVYEFGGKLYVNLTNRCSDDCVFCLRRGARGIGGTELWLDEEPSARELTEAIEAAGSFDDLVFCGFGEPTERLDTVKEVARFAKNRGMRTRLDTNGQGSLIQGRDIVPELVGLIDGVSVSLNASDAERYQRLCRSRFGLGAYPEILRFARACRDAGIDTVMSLVDSVGVDEIARCRKLCDEEGLPLKVRAYISDARAETETRLKSE